MSSNAHENVVNLGDYSQLQREVGNGPAAQVLNALRERASDKLQQNVGRMLEKLEDTLFGHSETAESAMVQQQYLETMQKLRLIRKDIEEAFITRLGSQFNQGIPRQAQSTEGFNLSWESSASISGHIDRNDMDVNLAITRMVNKIRDICPQALLELDTRIGFLIRDPDLERWQNPLAPEAICDALRHTTNRIDIDSEIRLIIFKLFDEYVVGNLDLLYEELNQQLVMMGVLPDIKAAQAVIEKSVAEDQTPAANPTEQQAPPGEQGAAVEETASPPETTTAAADIEAEKASVHSASDQSWVYALTFLQQGGIPGTDAGVGSESLPVRPADLASGQVNILRGLKNSTLTSDLAEQGEITIDMVAGLFDCILNDKSIPDGIGALIGRLQIPVLKVALLDSDFFIRKTHPVRQLLHCLTSTAVGWDEQHGISDPLYVRIESAVQTILDEFVDDTSLFDGLLEDLEDALREDRAQAQVRAERSAKIMEGQERLEIAKATTMEEIEPRVSDEQGLEFVREFVTSHWKSLLYIICARQGKDSDAWEQAITTMDELIWSVKPKHSSEERQRLLAIQPALLSNLREGMKRLSIPSSERDAFLAKLEHAQQLAMAESTEAITQEAAHCEDSPSPDTGFETASQGRNRPDRRVADTPAPQTHDRCTLLARGLKRGDWIELISIDGRARYAKLSWHSPVTDTFLFTDQQGSKVGSYSIDELVNLLRCARARVLNSGPSAD